MGMTVSMSVGRVAIGHDIREEISANVDVSLSHQNEIFIDKLKEYNHDVEAYTNAKFQPYIDEYNEKQKREERRKDKPYVEYIKAENEKLLQKAQENKAKGLNVTTRKPTKLVHEYVLQFGNREDNGVSNGADIDLNRRLAKKTLEDIQEKYPHADILLATFHADEPNGTPHMHILVQFTGEGYKQGLKRQISMSKALENDGFARSQNRGDYAINRWTKEVQDTIMEPNLSEFMEQEREVLNEGRQHEDIRIFREKAKAEAQALEEMQNAVDSKLERLDAEFEFAVESLKIEKEEMVQDLTETHKTLIEDVSKLEARKSALEGEIDALKASQGGLWLKFLNTFPKVKELFEKWCKNELEKLAQKKAERQLHREETGMDYFRSMVEKNRQDSGLLNRPQNPFGERSTNSFQQRMENKDVLE